jgi:hypothetical protein
MPNPKYIIKPNYQIGIGEATPELVGKMKNARNLFFRHLCSFCNQYGFDINEIAQTERVFLVGSQATEDKWTEESDLDLALVNSSVMISHLNSYKHKVLDPMLNVGKGKKDWTDIFFARNEEEVSNPRWDITDYW